MERTLELIIEQHDPDSKLVAQVRDGDRDAFDVLFERHKAYVYNLCYRMLGSAEDARDATQTAFIKAYNGLSKFRGGASFRTWVYQIATNVCLQAAKKQKRSFTLPLQESQVAESRNTNELMNEAIAQLSPDIRAVLLLVYSRGLSGEELAEALGCSHSSARTRLHRARQALKRKYEELQNEL